LEVLDSYARCHPSRLDDLQKWISNRSCHVAEAKGKLVAYGVLTYNFYGLGMVELLMVAERWRRTGIGTALIRHLMDVCASPKLWASTNLSNQPMQSFLAKAGFQLSGYIQGLDDDDPELVFMARLAEKD
jgi:GNAT superfamily N-acetyltransferase